MYKTTKEENEILTRTGEARRWVSFCAATGGRSVFPRI